MNPVSLSNLKVGFELEFCHDWSHKSVVNEIKSIFPKEKWISYTHRKDGWGETYLRALDKFTLTQDYTIYSPGDHSYELITPVWSFNPSKKKLCKILQWMDDTGAITNDTCGLHVNIGLGGRHISPQILIKNLNDKIWLARFNRLHNEWCKPQTKKVNLRTKFYSVNFRHKDYLEFRIIGGYNYHTKHQLILKGMDHFGRCLLKADLKNVFKDLLR